jgi:hypothetical protein
MVPTIDFSGLTRCARALASAAAIVLVDSLERYMVTGPRFEKVETNCAGFCPLGTNPMATASLASSGISAFSSAFERSWSGKAYRVLRNKLANSAQEFELLISTIRTASILGFGGSTPKRRHSARTSARQ